ncbi:MAG: Ig-like protein [Firmicutes bacterium]|nr:Ig-like protein [Bacillota bacterium]
MKKMIFKWISSLLTAALVFSLLTPAIAMAAEVEDAQIASYSITEGLVARWTFDGNYDDSVGGLTTKLGAKNLTYTKGVHGKAAVFNGKDNYLYVEPNDILNFGNDREENNDNFSISAWVNMGNAKTGTQYLLDKGKDIGWDKNDCFWTNPYSIWFDTCEVNVNLSNVFMDQNADIEIEGSSRTGYKNVEGEEWFLLTATYDGEQVKIYHDNTLLTQSSYSDGITFNEDGLYIGVGAKLDNFFRGSVDDLRLYNTTLSYDDVESLYQEGLEANKEFVEPTKQLVAYYAFDKNLNDSSTFSNDAENIAVNGTTKYVIGKNGEAIALTKGNYIEVPGGDHLNLEEEFTISCWVKVDTEGDYPLIYRQNPSFSDEEENDWTYMLAISSWGKGENTEFQMKTSVYDPDSWTPISGQGLDTQLNYVDNKVKSTNWIHYTCTYKDGQMISYINGKQFNKSDKSDFINIANASGKLMIGYDNSTFIKGSIDELKIYNSCLNATDVEKEAKRVDSISLRSNDNKAVASISKGKSVSISSIFLHDVDESEDTSIATADKNVKMSSSNKKIFTVAGGKITAVKAGKAKLTISYGPHSVSYNVMVK